MNPFPLRTPEYVVQRLPIIILQVMKIQIEDQYFKFKVSFLTFLNIAEIAGWIKLKGFEYRFLRHAAPTDNPGPCET